MPASDVGVETRLSVENMAAHRARGDARVHVQVLQIGPAVREPLATDLAHLRHPCL